MTVEEVQDVNKLIGDFGMWMKNILKFVEYAYI